MSEEKKTFSTPYLKSLYEQERQRAHDYANMMNREAEAQLAAYDRRCKNESEAAKRMIDEYTELFGKDEAIRLWGLAGCPGFGVYNPPASAMVKYTVHE